MKTEFMRICILSMSILAFASCEKEDKVVVTDSKNQQDKDAAVHIYLNGETEVESFKKTDSSSFVQILFPTTLK